MVVGECGVTAFYCRLLSSLPRGETQRIDIYYQVLSVDDRC